MGAARLRVRLMLDLGREADALTAAEVGLERWPGDRRLESRRVIALDALDRQDQALAAARALLRVNPGDVDAALVLVRREEPADAVQAALWTCIEANPGEPDLWLEFAMSHWIQGSQERAAPAARRAGQLLGRDIEPGERYARMCAELPCRGEHTEERR